MPVTKSTLDQDLYKVNMAANILRNHPRTPVKFKFKDRNPEGKFNDDWAKAFDQELEMLGDIKASDDEIQFLAERCPYLPPHAIDFMANFRHDPRQITYSIEDGNLNLEVDGNWETAMMWEIPSMYTISELYFQHCDNDWQSHDWESTYRENLRKKAHTLRFCNTSEFGTRRRRSYQVQDIVMQELKEHLPTLLGTSNIHFAHKYNIQPVGTMAHELFMGYSVLKGLLHANRFVMSDWTETFQGDMGVALTDTYGTEAFLHEFDKFYARIFDGVRHDSDCPYKFGDKIIAHYQSLKIDPKQKSIIFSDGLNANLAADLERNFRDQIKVGFGIGTHFTNDFEFLGSKALKIVVKLWSVWNGFRHQPVVKLSDNPAKHMGEEDAIRIAKNMFFGEPLDA